MQLWYLSSSFPAFRMFQWKKQNPVEFHSVKRPNHQTSGRKRSMRKRMQAIRSLACWKEMGSVGSKFGIPKDRVFRSLKSIIQKNLEIWTKLWDKSSLVIMLYIAFRDIPISVQGKKRYLPNDMGCITLKKTLISWKWRSSSWTFCCKKRRRRQFHAIIKLKPIMNRRFTS